jgi:hypothetical protein
MDWDYDLCAIPMTLHLTSQRQNHPSMAIARVSLDLAPLRSIFAASLVFAELTGRNLTTFYNFFSTCRTFCTCMHFFYTSRNVTFFENTPTLSDLSLFNFLALRRLETA